MDARDRWNDADATAAPRPKSQADGAAAVTPPRVVVYDGWLETLGGGERQVLAAASALRAVGPVTVIGHRAVAREALVDRSGVDLTDVAFATVPERAQMSAAQLAAGAALFVNGTHHSLVTGAGAPSIRFVYFPARPSRRLPALLGRGVRRLGGALGAAREAEGWFGPERRGRLRYRQSDGAGHLHAAAGARLRLWLSGMAHADRDYTVQTADGRAAARGAAGEGGRVAPSPWIDAGLAPARLVLRSSANRTSNPQEGRALGLALASIEERGSLARNLYHRLTRRLVPALGAWAADDRAARYQRALRSYDVVTSNSHYTAAWLQRRWGVAGPVIEPPVVLDASQAYAKDALIVSIGRFFAGGHNKKHLAMLRAFRELCRGGLTGWRLALVGGVGRRRQDREYLAQVRQAARGLPVDLLVEADEADVERLRRRAAIAWHAAGYGESARRCPERFEHFGMAVAELMACGAVPVVFDGGGLREIVEHGVSGYRWRTLPQLRARTLELARDARRRGDLGAAARRRADRWSLARYQRRILALARQAAAAHAAHPRAR